MCIIADVPPNVELPEATLVAMYDNNPDGWGIMWSEGGRVYSAKDITEFSDFKKNWDDVPKDARRALHFRIKTHGDISTANCHPFQILNKGTHGFDLSMMHNGVISTKMTIPNASDTANFAENELSPLLAECPNMLNNATFLRMLGEIAGGSRLLLMDGDGARWTTGHWTKALDVEFSNSHGFIGRTKPVQGVYAGYGARGYTGQYENNYNGWWSEPNDKELKKLPKQRKTYAPGYVYSAQSSCYMRRDIWEKRYDQKNLPQCADSATTESVDYINQATYGMTESEVFNYVAENVLDDPETVTDMVLLLRKGGL